MSDKPTICHHCNRPIERHPMTGAWLHSFTRAIYCVERHAATPVIVSTPAKEEK